MTGMNKTMNKPIESREQSFRDWLRSQTDESGVRRYTDNAIIAYCYALKNACARMEHPPVGNLFTVVNPMELEPLIAQITSMPEYAEVNREAGNGAFGVGMELYLAFLRGGGEGAAPDVSAPFYLRPDFSGDIYNDDRGRAFNYEEVPMVPIQRIYYGAPGTGKSYRVRRMLEREFPDTYARDAHSRRLIFHPTYTYEDFVGSIKPLITQDRPLDYVFTPGPLTLLLKEAFLHPAERYYLIIEEINRGNAPAIFGDLFQLLDRTESGKSEYAVTNVDMAGYFARDPGLKQLFYEEKIWFPANFNILATMNTADENIFVLDSAFKRRFALEYVRISYEGLPEELAAEYPTFAGERSLAAVFAGTELEPAAAHLAESGQLTRSWSTFAYLTNALIDLCNREAMQGDRPELARIPENKKLGPFFVHAEDIRTRENFLNKVVFYLKQDVFTYSERYLRQSYEKIYSQYAESNADVFELLKGINTLQ